MKVALRDGPFNFQGGGLWFFSKKIFWFPMLLKKIFWFWWRKNKLSDSEFLSYNLMLNSEKKFRTLRGKKKISILSENKFLNETKNHNPPLQVKWSVPKHYNPNPTNAVPFGVSCKNTILSLYIQYFPQEFLVLVNQDVIQQHRTYLHRRYLLILMVLTPVIHHSPSSVRC